LDPEKRSIELAAPIIAQRAKNIYKFYAATLLAVTNICSFFCDAIKINAACVNTGVMPGSGQLEDNIFRCLLEWAHLFRGQKGNPPYAPAPVRGLDTSRRVGQEYGEV